MGKGGVCERSPSESTRAARDVLRVLQDGNRHTLHGLVHATGLPAALVLAGLERLVCEGVPVRSGLGGVSLAGGRGRAW